MKPKVPASKYKPYIEFVEFLKANNAMKFFEFTNDYIFSLRSDVWIRAAFTWRVSGDYTFWQNLDHKWGKLQRERAKQMSVVDIDDFRPHLTINTLDGNFHVVPVALVESWIIGDIEPNKIIVRKIIQEWLDFVTKEKPDAN